MDISRSKVSLKMNKLTTFYIVRHAETEYNTKQLAQGHLDSPLTERGINGARARAEKLRDIEFDLIFSSDLLRAKRTAEIIKLERQLEVKTTEMLRERYYGPFEGKPGHLLSEFREFLVKLKEAGVDISKNSPVESDESLVTRLLNFIRETSYAYPGKNILAVTHGGVIRIFLMHLGYKSLTRKAVENTGYVKIETDGVEFFVREAVGIELDNRVRNVI